MDKQGIVPEALDILIREKRPAMVLINPTHHNPTTTTLPENRRIEVLDICRRWNIPLVEGDALGYLSVFGTPRPPRPLKVLDTEYRVIYVSTLSKIAAPGLRIGWVIAPKPIVDRLADIKGQIDLGMTGVSQILAAKFLSSPFWPQHVVKVQQALRARRDHLTQALKEYLPKNLTVNTPNGGLYFWIHGQGSESDLQRLDEAIRHGMIYVPGRFYGSPDGFLRLNYVWEEQNKIESVLPQLRSILTGPS